MAPKPLTCVACGRPFAENRELATIPDADKIAFDSSHGRVWRVCTACEEWNLVGADGSAAALPELEARFAASVPMGAKPEPIGVSRVGSRLELLRVDATCGSDADDSLGLDLHAEVNRRKKMFRRLMVFMIAFAAVLLVVEAAVLKNDIGVWALAISGWAQVVFLFGLAKRLGGGNESGRSLAVKGAAVAVFWAIGWDLSISGMNW